MEIIKFAQGRNKHQIILKARAIPLATEHVLMNAYVK